MCFGIIKMFGVNKTSRQFKSGCKRYCGLGRRKESAIYIMTVDMLKEGKVVIALKSGGYVVCLCLIPSTLSSVVGVIGYRS